jgi:Uma2 family endonuclease
MGTKALISPEQYLATHYEREPEYVRGELKEKPMPDRIHGHIQAMLIVLFRAAAKHLSAEAEVRCRLAPDVYRLPDIALFSNNDLLEKLRDYEQWGVPRIWVVNPWTKTLAEWRNGALLPIDSLTLPEYGLEVRLQQLIEGLPL